MINLKKTIVKLDEFTDYVGDYCGYKDYHVLDKLDDLTTKSLIICKEEIKNQNFVYYPYYDNLVRHISKTLQSRKNN